MFRWISDNTVVVRGGDSDAVQLNKLPVFLAQLDWAVALLDVEISKILGSNPNNTNVEIADSSEHWFFLCFFRIENLKSSNVFQSLLCSSHKQKICAPPVINFNPFPSFHLFNAPPWVSVLLLIDSIYASHKPAEQGASEKTVRSSKAVYSFSLLGAHWKKWKSLIFCVN